ncbi:MAG TPA: efflux RND transporter permease subunit [Gemmatimonadales bacterium]|nr:efflux RND transporter permease subunit [Gemmatimonadales bacterium]
MISWATSRPAVIWASAVALVLAGAVAFTRLPLATKTTVELPRLSVTATWYGASAELLETYLTSPMEAAIQGVRGVRKVNSTSSDRQGTRITVELEPDVDVQLVRLAIHERLELLRKDFPPGATAPTVSNYLPEELEEQPLLRYSLSGPYTPGALSRLSREQIQPRLNTIPGVGSVRTYGSAETGVSVSYDATRLRQLGIPPSLLTAAIAGARMVQALGEERIGASERTVVLRDQPRAYQDLERLPIRAPSGRVFELGELASIRPEEDTRGVISRSNGVPRVGLEMTRLAGADAIQTAARVKAAMAEIHGLLPPGIQIRLENDESVELAKQLGSLLLRGAIAFAAVCLVLLLVLRHLRSAVLVMGTVVVAIAGTTLGLYLLKIPANLLTLAGLGMGIGILVDNGAVVVERLRHAPNTREGRAEAARRITPAVLGSTLTTAVVLFPFLYLQGNARAAFMPFAAAFALALLWSVLSSVVMIPAIGGRLGREAAAWPRLHRAYGATLRPLVRWRWITIALAAGLVGLVSWGFVKRVPRSFWGNWFGQRTTVTVSINFPRGSDPESLDRAIREFENLAVGRTGVERVDVRGAVSSAQLQVLFTREAGITALPLVVHEEMTQRAVLVGGATIGVYGQGAPFSSGGGGSMGATFRIKVLGYSFRGVERVALDLKDRLETIPRVRTVNINAGGWSSDRAVSVVLTPDRAALARHGVTAGDFAAAINREIRGQAGGQRLEFDGEETTVSVKAAGARERSLDELRAALVPNPGSSPVRIGDLAEVGEREGLATISREDQQYVRIVSYDFRGPQRLANRTHQAFMKSITAPAGYTVADQQFTWDEDRSARGLWLVFGAGVVLVLLVVALIFDSAWAAAMVFLSLPLALAGVGGIFWATKTAFNREAAVGVILVVGLAVNQAILLIDAALEKRRSGGPADGRSSRRLSVDDVIHAAADRSGMIVLVTLTTLASLIPLAAGTASDSLFGSIALATAGGTIAGTIGALWILPALLVSRRPRAEAAVAPASG